MANTIILQFRFKDDNNGINDFSFIINTQNIQTVDDLKHALVTGRHVTYNNFDLYRNDTARDVKEHMSPSTAIREFFPGTHNVNDIHVLIYPR
ncbi:unnamed protein product [Rhizophagus irregularis]|nr:unnamed protein product [Rhizophagus irregularis]